MNVNEENRRGANELSEQELEQAVGGIIFDKGSGEITTNFRCPKCGATQKVKTESGLNPRPPMCDKCRVQMVKA